MASGDQVGARFNTSSFVAPVVLSALGLAGAGLTLALGPWEAAAAVAALTAPFLLWAFIAGGLIAARRRWLQIEDNGFVVTDFRGIREIRDTEVEHLAIREYRVLNSGILQGYRREIRVRTSSMPADGWLELRTLGDPQVDERLVGLWRRLVGGLYERSKQALAAGRTLTGEGWRLEREGLRSTAGGEQPLLRFGQIAAFQFVDDAFCIWLRGEEHPTLRIASGTANVQILQALLEDFVPKDVGRSAAAVGDGLGRIIFERRTMKGAGFLWVLAALAVGLGVLFGVTRMWAGAAIATPIGLLLGWWAFEAPHLAFRCHELGVCKVSRTQKKMLRYEDVAAFSYSGTRNFYNGAYTGTSYVFTFMPRTGVAAPKIVYSATLQGDDEEMENVKAHVAVVIARQMSEELDKTGAVDWTARARIGKQALEYRPSKLFGLGEWTSAGYDQIEQITINSGECSIFVTGVNAAAVTIPVSEANFFPGYVLLTMRQPKLFE